EEGIRPTAGRALSDKAVHPNLLLGRFSTRGHEEHHLTVEIDGWRGGWGALRRGRLGPGRAEGGLVADDHPQRIADAARVVVVEPCRGRDRTPGRAGRRWRRRARATAASA